MSAIKTLFAAGIAGSVQAAPAFNAAAGNETADADGAVTPAYYGCYPVYRWVYTYYGWQRVYAGERCPSRGYYGYPYSGPHGRFVYRSPGLRIGIGF